MFRSNSIANAPISSFRGSGCITASVNVRFSKSYRGVRCSWLTPLGIPSLQTKDADAGLRSRLTAVPSMANRRKPRKSTLSASVHSKLNRFKDCAEYRWFDLSAALADCGRGDFNTGGRENPTQRAAPRAYQKADGVGN